MSGAGRFSDIAELYAHALAMEREAESRYALLADQMAVHNNREIADFFRQLSEVEGRHADEIAARAAALELPDIAPHAPQWPGLEGPETVDLSEPHYLMTPHHALSLALRAEESALGFFRSVAEQTADSQVRAMAVEMAEEEQAHAAQVRDMLARHPAPAPGWDDDPDPPAPQE